jgi:hypothetical protein
LPCRVRLRWLVGAAVAVLYNVTILILFLLSGALEAGRARARARPRARHVPSASDETHPPSGPGQTTFDRPAMSPPVCEVGVEPGARPEAREEPDHGVGPRGAAVTAGGQGDYDLEDALVELAPRRLGHHGLEGVHALGGAGAVGGVVRRRGEAGRGRRPGVCGREVTRCRRQGCEPPARVIPGRKQSFFPCDSGGLTRGPPKRAAGPRGAPSLPRPSGVWSNLRSLAVGTVTTSK